MLLKEIRAIAGETLVISPHDRDAERANTSWFGAPPHERMGMTADEVVSAFQETAELLRDQVATLPYAGPATFYVWHDGEAGQLRCSTVSCGHDALPFDAPYRATSDLHGIVAEFLEDRAPGALVWGEQMPVPFAGDDGERAVWVCSLCP
ncbi:hypothetical protein [Actinoplanes subtropicus]|uniref:hypothetical protein n=1 Tax=Actinoplanes subtropicus TaxID=543632 RepID=UPI0004C3CF9A|nr:hypothetical protein [Actinoplanes subtropicus]